MKDTECIQFLQHALPSLRLRWPGYRKVRAQVCKRIRRRVKELGLADSLAYRAYLETHRDEWDVLDRMCHITISRFYRDKGVFESLEQTILPEIAGTAITRGEQELRCWSVGCASGEEAYTLALLWRLRLMPRFPVLSMQIVATDVDEGMLGRAHLGCYRPSSLSELPQDWLVQGFVRSGNAYCVHPKYREGVFFLRQDLRSVMPDGPFHLVMCRNIAFTYFEEALQREVLQKLRERLHPGGVLVIGCHESLPQGAGGFVAWPENRGVYRKTEVS